MRRLPLFTAILAAPLAWLVFLQAEYMLVPWACHRGAERHSALYVVAGLALLVAAGSALLAWRHWTLSGRGDAAAAPPVGRSTFLALTGIGSSVLFFVVILAAALPLLWLTPCD
jgi:hypothetical protein